MEYFPPISISIAPLSLSQVRVLRSKVPNIDTVCMNVFLEEMSKEIGEN